jgi:UDP-N-acetylmuramoylalanine--D-glutamate ligase
VHVDALRGRRIALLGLGIDVAAAVPAILAAEPAQVVLVEAGTGELDGIEKVDLGTAATTAEVFVRSPGYPRYGPELTAALARGARMTTPIDLWIGTHRAGRTVIGVTGTKGKSTVTELIGALAAEAGLRIGVAGNIGVPVFAPGWDAQAPLVVLEISSYQAADLHEVPDIAVVTFLAEDHLSWHGGRDQYLADKLRVVRNESGEAPRVLIPEFGGDAAAVLGRMGVVPLVVTPPDGPPELPVHRVRNAALAAAAVHAAGGPAPEAWQVLDAATRSLPGRLDVCPGPESVVCVDDALASNPSATAAALAWARSLGQKTVVLLGGADRGVSVAPLADEVARWPAGQLWSVALPDNGSDLAAAIGLDGEMADDVADAVRRGLSLLGTDGILLFSPAAPTPPSVGTWVERSTQFRQALRSSDDQGSGLDETNSA